jgi:predicted RNase H-like nuclease
VSWLAGVDGCRRGWFRVARESDSGELAFHLLETAAQLISAPPGPNVLALDIPIGLLAAGRRECDGLARRRLGVRGSSVFPAPIRPALDAHDREEASRLTELADGRRVSCQAWNLVPKIRAVDALLREDVSARRVIHEVHPELSFWAWNGGRPMQAPKKSREGRAERLRLAEAWLGDDLLARARGAHLRRHLADDDILDAVAALWTAHRIADGRAERLPASPPRDEHRLAMQIVF